MAVEIDLISFFKQNPEIADLLKQDATKIKPNTNPEISLKILEAYNLGLALVHYLKEFGENQRKQALLSKEEDEKHALLQNALKEAMTLAATQKTASLKLIVEKNLHNLKEQDFTYRIEYTKI